MKITAKKETNYVIDLSEEDILNITATAIEKAYKLPTASFSPPDEVFEKDGEWWVREEFHGHTSYFEERKLRKITKTDKQALAVIKKVAEEFQKPSYSPFRAEIKNRPTTISER